MTAALVSSMQQILPGNVFQPIPEAMMRYFLGDDTAEMLGLSRCDLTEALLEPLRVVNFIFGHQLHASEPLARVHEAFSRKLLRVCYTSAEMANAFRLIFRPNSDKPGALTGCHKP